MILNIINNNSHMHSQQGLCPIGADCYHTSINPLFKIKSLLSFMPNISAIAIAPYKFFRLYHFKLSTFYFDGVVRGLHPTKLYFMSIWFFGALENSILGNFLNYQKYDNLTNFSLKLFFNVTIIKSDRSTQCQ